MPAKKATSGTRTSARGRRGSSKGNTRSNEVKHHPPNKAQRQHRIARLLAEQPVSSQSQLVDLLSAAGIQATQATVSRDLEDLGAIKVRAPGGATMYAIPELPTDQLAPSDHLRRVLGEWLGEIQRSGDMVVLRSPPGTAHVVASALDRSGLTNLIGTVAGDDTLLAIATEGAGAALANDLADLAGLPNE